VDDLIKMIAEKFGLSPAQAKDAITMVLTYIKTKLPPPIAAQLEAILNGKTPDLGNMGSVIEGLGGIFKGK
jgi:nucleoid DNA-binding protein